MFFNKKELLWVALAVIGAILSMTILSNIGVNTSDIKFQIFVGVIIAAVLGWLKYKKKF